VKRGLLPVVLPVGLLAILPLVVTTYSGRTVMTTAVVYAVIASGLGLVYSQLGLLAMSHAGLWGIGSFTAAILITKHGLSFWWALLATVAITTVCGAVSGIPAFRMKGHQLLLVGFILTQLLVAVGDHWRSLTGGPNGIVVGAGPGKVLGIDFGSIVGFYYLCAATLVLLVAFAAFVRRTTLGRRFLTVRENVLLANSLGLDHRVLIVAGYGLSGIFAGAGGTLHTINLRAVQPEQFGLHAAILLPLIVMLGGWRHVWGPVAGAFIVVELPEVIGLSPQDAQAVNGILLVAIILLMPDGVLGGLAPVRAWLRGRSARAPAEPMSGAA
jgi:branched-chain amino acid transport system permease protein